MGGGELPVCVILVLCTANLCRSPMAAALLSRHLARARVPAAVGSAGMLPGGATPPGEVIAAIGEYGLDISGHRSRQVTPADLAAADLTLTMERAHLRHAVVLTPQTWPRAFTIREFLRRAGEAGPRRAGDSLGQWLDRVHEGRQRASLLGNSAEDDLPDPIGGPPAAYQATAATLDQMAGTLVRAAWPDQYR